jgi:hypothetical protein
MPISILRLLARVLSLTLIVSTSATAESKFEMHRVGVNVDDGSGWYSAVSQGFVLDRTANSLQ